MTDIADISDDLDRISAIIDAFAAGARNGQAVDLNGLDAKVDSLCQAIALVPEDARGPIKPRLIDLIDRLNRLVESLGAQQADLAGTIKDVSSRQRAVSAYGKGAGTGKPPRRGGGR